MGCHGRDRREGVRGFGFGVGCSGVIQTTRDGRRQVGTGRIGMGSVTVVTCSNITRCFVCCLNTLDSVQTCHTFISMCSNRVQTACHAVVCCSNTVRSVQTSCAALRAVRTCSDMSYIHFHVFKPCSNSPPCSGVLFEHHTLLRVLSKHCSDSVRTCHTFVSMCSNSLVLFGNV